MSSEKLAWAAFACVVVACVLIAFIPIVGWFLAGPLLLASFVIGIVAIVKGAVGSGIVVILLSVILPAITQFVSLAFFVNTLSSDIESEKIAGSSPAPVVDEPSQQFADVTDLFVTNDSISVVGENLVYDGVIENRSNFPLQGGRFTVNWVDGSGKTISRNDIWISDDGRLGANGKWPFRCEVYNDLKIKKHQPGFKISEPPVEVSSIKSHVEKPSVEILSVNFTSENGIAKVTGEVRNDTNRRIHYVKIIVSFYDVSENFIDTDFAYIEFDSLAPGAVSPYKVTGFVSDKANKVSVAAEWRYFD